MVYDKKAVIKQWKKNDRIKNPKKYTILKWKEIGLISTDYDLIYSCWKNSTNCEKCQHDYSYWHKCMDHNHITGAFRNILCSSCNSNDKDNNTTGYPNISYGKRDKLWRYQKSVKKINHSKFFKTKNEAIIYKWLYELGYSIEL